MAMIEKTVAIVAGMALTAVLAVAPALAQDPVGEPATPAPAAASPAAKAAKPAAPKPVARKPAAKPASPGAAESKRATPKPAAQKPAAPKPAASGPAARKPAAGKSPAAKPVAVGGAWAVTVAPAIVPAPDLLATAKQLRDAAAAKDPDAVAALIADDVTVVAMGIDLASAPRVTREGPYTAPADLLAVVGRNAGEAGDVPPGTPQAKLDERLRSIAFAHIVASIDRADWGRDPLVKGGFCTYRGRSWNVAALKAAVKGTAAITGGTVDGATPVRRTADAEAPIVATLTPGQLYLDDGAAEAANGWRAVRSAKGRIGWVEGKALRAPQTSGICFLPNVDGGWLMSAVAGVGP